MRAICVGGWRHALVAGRACLRPFGYLAFVLAVAALSSAAWLLGERDDLGFFAGRLSQTIRRYPEVTRRGVQVAWLAWAVLFAVALTDDWWWDDPALAAGALIVCWRTIMVRSRDR